MCNHYEYTQIYYWAQYLSTECDIYIYIQECYFFNGIVWVTFILKEIKNRLNEKKIVAFQRLSGGAKNTISGPIPEILGRNKTPLISFFEFKARFINLYSTTFSFRRLELSSSQSGILFKYDPGYLTTLFQPVLYSEFIDVLDNNIWLFFYSFFSSEGWRFV